MKIALIGFGEVGQIIAADLAGHDLRAYDVLFDHPDSSPALAAKGASIDALDAPHAAEGAELIISAVTAANTLQAAASVTPQIGRGVVFLDLNSASPGMKQAAAQTIDGVGGSYVEGAVMSPFSPKRLASPTLLGGPHAAKATPMLQSLGFAGVEVFSDEVGLASATKMCRSVIVKGMEALIGESLLTARRYGVEKTVLASLSDLLPVGDWEALAKYMISRSLEHGTRRAEEMVEAAKAVDEAGIEPLMSRAIAARQSWAAGHKGALAHDETLFTLLDGILGDDQ
jgi:3-hydroxyisobutyrate dehydrogenase-like beta-hydroxyacid dehydrogenase